MLLFATALFGGRRDWLVPVGSEPRHLIQLIAFVVVLIPVVHIQLLVRVLRSPLGGQWCLSGVVYTRRFQLGLIRSGHLFCSFLMLHFGRRSLAPQKLNRGISRQGNGLFTLALFLRACNFDVDLDGRVQSIDTVADVMCREAVVCA